ncbi:MAG: DUF4180 domain-containing protein [Pseudomonadota bacterium]|uniref:DUF4180 domain-containing protein n=1 Tax=unclassified Phenylobacterium TaxID=2640670 RepID=UPI0006F1DD4D|nr:MULTISPECIES: DUF4180 domain-containing protein [unclassified Phenylobacterium]KRB42526.1 hypothetical protein ASE02_21600 [Phenylobacterium sp. Root700]MBT9471623.1 DUF4180 domain-containing protein [Phenylobacterium sp.]
MTGQVTDIGALRAFVWNAEGPLLATSRDASDLVGEAFSADARLVVVPVERLGGDFLKLSSGLAGEVLQKFVNYGLKIAILGDVSAASAASGPLRDFIYESNRGKSVWFAPDMAALEALVARG